jgi:hypothetical protein
MVRVIKEIDVKDSMTFVGEKQLTHPAFGQIAVSRRHGGRTALYGSDFPAETVIAVTLTGSTLYRGLSRDSAISDSKPIVELEMSESQWAAFVSSMNFGSGVQCTVRYVKGDHIPGFPLRDQKDEFASEMDSQSKDAIAALQRAKEALLSSRISQRDANAVIEEIDTAIREIGVNAEYVQTSFGKHMEKRTERAKMEINAYAQRMIFDRGVESLSGSSAPIAIEKMDE